MTEEQRIATVVELVSGMSAKEIRDFAYDIDDALETKCQEQCEKEGHNPGDDHCGRPEHRFCYTCHKSLPNVELPARQAKADEAVAGKATLPSESLGSGSKSTLTKIWEWLTKPIRVN